MSEFIKSFVRRGRKLSKAKADLRDELLPKLAIDLNNLSSKNAKINLEIGFGDGRFLSNIAIKKPDEIFLGCEPYMQGVVSLLEDINLHKIENIFIWNDDARLLIEKMPDNFLSKTFILFPDPWPKAKHNKRRIINKGLLDLLAEKMIDKGELYIATDHEDYHVWIMEVLSNHPKFHLEAGYDWQAEFGGVDTSYKDKALRKNISSHFMKSKLIK